MVIALLCCIGVLREPAVCFSSTYFYTLQLGTKTSRSAGLAAAAAKQLCFICRAEVAVETVSEIA